MEKVILKGFIEIPEAERSQVLAALPEHKKLTLQEPGCIVFKVEPDEEFSNRYTVYEEFVSQEAFASHQKRVKESTWGKVTANVKRHYQVHVEDLELIIKTIIFDIGGVLWQPLPEPVSDKWADRCGLSKAEFDEIVFNYPDYASAATGKISDDDIWAVRNKQLGLSPIELAELRSDSWNGKWDNELFAFIQTLKPHYKLGILSDATTGARERVQTWINEALFDAILFSYEAGMQKPDPALYRQVLDMLGATAVTTLFIDDHQKNVQAALDLGMHSFQYTSTPEAIATMQRLLKQTL